MSKASPAKYTNIDVANATLDAAEDRIAELRRDLERARAALERIACIPCNDPRCTEERPCATHIAREALPSWRLDADREEERAKCSRCNGTGQWFDAGDMRWVPCRACTPAPSAADEEKCSRCKGTRRVMVPCPDGSEGCLVAHFGPCPDCTPAPSAAAEEKPKRWGIWCELDPSTKLAEWLRSGGKPIEFTIREAADRTAARRNEEGGCWRYEVRELPADAEAGKETKAT